MLTKKRKRLVSIFQVVFLFLLTVFISGYFSFYGVEPHHHGIMLKPAYDMNHGLMLFRDSFTQYGALTSILQFFALHIFGNHLIVINLLTALFYGLVVVFLWLSWSLFLPPILATVSCLIWLFLAPYFLPDYFFLPWSSVYSLFFQLVTTYTFLRYLKSRENVWQISAGVAAALTFWARQPVGFFMIGSILLFIFISKIKKYKSCNLFPFFISYMLVHSIFLSWLFTNKALDAWYYQTIKFPFLWTQSLVKTHIPFSQVVVSLLPNPLPATNQILSLWAVLPLIMICMGYVLLISKDKSKQHVMFLFGIVISLSSWLQYYPVSDIRHLYWAATPMIGFTIYSIWQQTGVYKKYALFCLICFLLFAPDIFYRLQYGRRKIIETASYVSLTKPAILSGMKVKISEKKEYEKAMDAVEQYEKKYPHTFITTTARDALYSMFDGKSINCSAFTVNWNWKTIDESLEKKYSQAMKGCIDRYKPLVFSEILGYQENYQPVEYTRVTKGAPGINYLLIPDRP
jgi:hypothetical protein